MDKIRILVVDDEESLCEILKFNLEKEGYFVDTALSAEEALTMNIASYNLLLLDVMMGEISGFKLASILKNSKTTAAIPIIFCTAKDTEKDTVEGLTIGADDYISKPFSIQEVIARVKAVLRRSQQQTKNENSSTLLRFENLVIDTKSKKVTLNGNTISLTKKEFELLVLLVGHPNVVFNRETLLEKIWEDDVLVIDRTIDVHITRLRKKIIPYDKHLVTRLGYGYCFEM
ncbi:MAG: response regulator transcription factor [Bacteroidales bacterium]|nr:response regulator transcription factor [Bacteroidales bacterium]MDD4208975.1 response regulator transcription factor [Bacteroidales bacterium]